jgi:hypothetical protein
VLWKHKEETIDGLSEVCICMDVGACIEQASLPSLEIKMQPRLKGKNELIAWQV